jgi:hypothetical protein
MKRSLMPSIVASAVVVLALVTFAAPVGAQGEQPSLDQNSKPSGPVPRMPDGKPDLSGVWWQGHDFDFNPTGARNAPRAAAAPRPRVETYQSLYQPSVAEKAKALSDKDDPALYCIPTIDGPQTSDIFQLVQTPKLVVYLQETYHGFRLIPTEPGSKHSEEAPLAFRGDSVGRWEGDTLVVDVTNFNPRNWIFYAVNGPAAIHSDALHVVERYRRVAANALEVEKTYEDPKVLTRPWVRPKKVYALAPFGQIMEAVCTINATAVLMEAGAKENYGRK